MKSHLSNSCLLQCLLLWTAWMVSIPLESLAALPNDDEDFRNVPVISGEPLHTVHSILLEGANEPRRILIFGDSQETSPGGSGSVYIPHLQMQLKNRFGYVGETPFYGFSPMGSGQPTADWLVGVSQGSMGPQYINDSSLPPGMRGTRNRLPQEGSNQELGTFFTLLHDASLTRDGSLGTEDVMVPTNTIIAELLIRKNGNSSGAMYVQRPTNNYNTWTAATGSGNFVIRDKENAPDFSLGQSQALNRGNGTYHRIEIFGDDVKQPTEILAVRFVDTDRRMGIVAHSFSKGGYTANSLQNNHAYCGDVLHAVEGHLALVQYGANDLLEVNATGFESRLHSLIDFIRESVNDPCFPIVIVGEGWRYMHPDFGTRQDTFAGAAARVAQSRDRVTAINMRRVMEDKYFYWGEGQRDHVIDGVHLSHRAQADFAETLADIVLPPIHASCRGDFNGDGIVDSQDIGLLMVEFNAGEAKPEYCRLFCDLDGDGYVNGLDLGMFFTLWGVCPREYVLTTDGPTFGE